MRTSTFIPLAAALSLGLTLPSLAQLARADGKADRPDVLSVDEIKKGMKGYGLTVFEGEKPSRFDVEVIDVLHGFKPRQELILVKTDHPRLDVAKIVGGMSGSPIYIKGKMIGAYAYGWTFGVEPVAGVTPIRAMLDDLARPLPELLHGIPLGVSPNHRPQTAVSTGSQAEASWSGSVSRGTPRGRYAGALEGYSVHAHAQQLAEQQDRSVERGDVRLTPVSTPLLLGGMNHQSTEVLRELLEPLGLLPVQAGGVAAPGGQSPAKGFVDGGALGVNLVSGDISAMGLGTVTRVEGQRLVAFGHPMMNIGVTALPTTEARILWFMASQMRSFKMGEATSSNGALVNDRQASIVVDQRAQAPVVDVELHVRGEPGAPYEDWSFQLAHDPFLTPSLLGASVGNALTAAAAERRDVTWTMTTRLEFDGFSPIEIQDIGASPAGTPQAPQVMQSDALEAVGQIFNNPWENAQLTRVRVDVQLRFAREVARLRGARLLSPEVDPGGEARILLHLEPFEGTPTTRLVKVPIPERYAGESLKIQIRPGYLVEPVRAAPESLAELMANLGSQPENPRSIALSFAESDTGAAYGGVVAERLPLGAMDRLMSESSSLSPETFQSTQHHFISSPLYLVGSDTVEVRVRDERLR